MDSVYSPTWRLVSLLSWLRLITSSSDRFGAANPSQLCEKYRTSSSSTTPARAPPMTRRSNAARIFQTSRPRRLQFSICVATANNRSSASNIVPPRRPTACCWHSKPILQCLPGDARFAACRSSYPTFLPAAHRTDSRQATTPLTQKRCATSCGNCYVGSDSNEVPSPKAHRSHSQRPTSITTVRVRAKSWIANEKRSRR